MENSEKPFEPQEPMSEFDAGNDHTERNDSLNASRRAFMRKLGAAGVAVGLSHFVRLVPSTVFAADACNSGLSADDLCTETDEDACPGGASAQDECVGLEIDECPGGSDAYDECGSESRDVCPGGNSELDHCDLSQDTEGCQLQNPSEQDDCSGGYDTCRMNENDPDVCIPVRIGGDEDQCRGTTIHGYDPDECPGGLPSVDDCSILDGGDECPGGVSGADE